MFYQGIPSEKPSAAEKTTLLSRIAYAASDLEAHEDQSRRSDAGAAFNRSGLPVADSTGDPALAIYYRELNRNTKAKQKEQKQNGEAFLIGLKDAHRRFKAFFGNIELGAEKLYDAVVDKFTW